MKCRCLNWLTLICYLLILFSSPFSLSDIILLDKSLEPPIPTTEISHILNEHLSIKMCDQFHFEINLNVILLDKNIIWTSKSSGWCDIIVTLSHSPSPTSFSHPTACDIRRDPPTLWTSFLELTSPAPPSLPGKRNTSPNFVVKVRVRPHSWVFFYFFFHLTIHVCFLSWVIVCEPPQPPNPAYLQCVLYSLCINTGAKKKKNYK